MEEVRTFQVAVDSTERLDRFLADQLALSRTQVGRLIAAGAVRVNGIVGRAGRGLSRGDVVECTLPDAPKPRTLQPFDLHLEVMFEDEHLLVLDKPAGLVVHPAPGHWNDTLLNALMARGTSLSSGPVERRGIVHRLDRDTSGLMLVAKTDRAHRRLARALERRQIERQYAALIWGHLDEARQIDAPIRRHPGDRKRMAVIATGRPARTRFEPIARFACCDLVRAELETGRTHQIRVHAAHIGHPVVGDPVYRGGGAQRIDGFARKLAERVEHAASRQVLHAARLGFRHPETEEQLSFQSEWPGDLRECLSVAADDLSLVARDNALQYLGFFQQDG